jgi:D-alanine--poly(phosphoribitol) ligase subunit 1
MTAHNLALRFEETVASSPDAVALLCEGDSFAFSELDRLANRSARWLTSRGVNKGAVVCLELPKIAEAYALAIACIKIGAPYAFLDPAAPEERARLMLERCRPALIVSVREGVGPRTLIGCKCPGCLPSCPVAA